MAPIIKSDATPPTLSQLQTSLTSLTTAAHILDGFAHRNKNQHRATRWWGPFAMLRRHLHRILPDLDGAVRRAEVLSSSHAGAAAASFAPSSKRRKVAAAAAAGGGSSGRAPRQPELDRVVERATWLGDVLGVKCYEAFTQLAADRQFAPLGLVLVGVLAQVEAALAPLVPGAAAAAGDKTDHQTRVLDGAVSTTRAAVPSAGGGGGGGGGDVVVVVDDDDDDDGGGGGRDDLGVAVSRDEVVEKGGDGALHQAAGVPGPSSRAAKRPPADEDEEREHEHERTKSKKRSRKPETGLGSSRAGAEDMPEPVNPKEVKKAKKKKKKKKGGDEFDDLFSSLV